MKKILFLLLVFGFVFVMKGYSTTYTVKVGYLGLSAFFPNNITDAHIGDVIKFVWESGIHTTTSTTVPSGAAVWDHPIISTDTVFSYTITKEGLYNYQCTHHAIFGMTGSFTVIPTAIERIGTVVNNYALEQNYPNPFNPSTTIKFSIPKSSFVTLKIYDISGRVIKTLVNSELPTGDFKYTLDASEISSGIYFYKLEADNFKDIKRMALIK